MDIDEFKRLSAQVKEVSERYYNAGMEGGIPEALVIEMKEIWDKYNQGCQQYFSILKNEAPGAT